MSPNTPLQAKLRTTWRPVTTGSRALILIAVQGLGVGCSGGESGENNGMGDLGGTPGVNTPAPGTPTSGAPAPGSSVTPGVPTPPGSGTSVGVEPAPVTPGAPPATPIDVANADCTVPKAPTTLMRRLTAFEYYNAIQDLFDLSVTTQIPLDGVTDGYNNNTSVLNVSSLHAEKFVLASEEIAKAAVQNITSLAPCSAADEAGEEACARTFAQTTGRRVFRRDIAAADEAALMSAYAMGRDGGSYAEGIEVMLRAMLQSPFFLYKVEQAQQTPITGATVSQVSPFELASRLSFLIWGSIPSDALLDAASAGDLSTKEQVATWARTMLADEKAKRGVVDFYQQWLGTSKVGVTQKNTDLFPVYTPAVQTAMAEELPAFMSHLLWQGDKKLATMFTSSVVFMNKDSAALYGVQNNASDVLEMVELPADQERAGVLTQAGFLSVQAHPDQTSPVLRGKFVRTKLMCQPPPPPPPDADITPPDVTESATARQRFSAHMEAGSSCSSCHALMDPIGFAFEHFSAVGEYRLRENDVEIDVSGEIVGGEGSLAGPFSGVRELGAKLAESPVVQNCVATQWFRYAAGRNEAPGDECSLSTLQSQFGTSGGDLVELVVAMTQTDAFMYRPVTEVTQ